MNTSLCRLCLNPSACPLCAIVRDPRPLKARDLADAARVFAAQRRDVAAIVNAPRVTPAPAPARAPRVSPPMPAPIWRTRSTPPAAPAVKLPDPEKTAPAFDRSPTLAEAPAPLPPPAAPVRVLTVASEPLKRGDWQGLSARVDAGKLTTAEAERIGAEWMSLHPAARA